jgi:hypothetical protein
MFRCLLSFLILWPAFLSAQSQEEGKKLFGLHCAACHGSDATGKGAVASALSEPPVDLTILARRNGGVFPATEVVRKIDGRTPLQEHGVDMPVYGWFFEGSTGSFATPDGLQVETTEAIAAIILWLNAIQR